MNKNLMTVIALALVTLVFCASTVFAQDQSKGPPPFPPPSAQSLLENGYLYVPIGPSILQYKVEDMSLQNTITPGSDSSNQASSSTQKTPIPPIVSMVTDGDYLYIVVPGYIFKYGKLPELELITKQKQGLPKP
jgi:hypothetical protein